MFQIVSMYHEHVLIPIMFLIIICQANELNMYTMIWAALKE
jgi:hypothetical protein